MAIFISLADVHVPQANNQFLPSCLWADAARSVSLLRLNAFSEEDAYNVVTCRLGSACEVHERELRVLCNSVAHTVVFSLLLLSNYHDAISALKVAQYQLNSVLLYGGQLCVGCEVLREQLVFVI